MGLEPCMLNSTEFNICGLYLWKTFHKKEQTRLPETPWALPRPFSFAWDSFAPRTSPARLPPACPWLLTCEGTVPGAPTWPVCALLQSTAAQSATPKGTVSLYLHPPLPLLGMLDDG